MDSNLCTGVQWLVYMLLRFIPSPSLCSRLLRAIYISQRDSDDHHRDREREREKKSRRHRHAHSDARPDPAYATIPVVAPGESTKVFYYMLSEKNETPYVTIVPKR